MQVDACVSAAAETLVCCTGSPLRACLVERCMYVYAYGRASGIGGPRCSVRILDLGERVALAVKTLKCVAPQLRRDSGLTQGFRQR